MRTAGSRQRADSEETADHQRQGPVLGNFYERCIKISPLRLTD